MKYTMEQYKQAAEYFADTIKEIKVAQQEIEAIKGVK